MLKTILNNTNQKSLFTTPKAINKVKFSILSFILIFFIIFCIEASQFCNSTACYPCHYKCKTCSGIYQTQCIDCQQEYVNFNGTCYSCGDNCESCQSNISSIATIQNVYKYCQSCIAGYYLNQASGVCIKCSTGAQLCTLSQIQSCANQYFMANGICQKCISNCLICTNSSTCIQCMNQYTLAGTICIKCAYQNCSQCQNPTSICQACISGYTGDYCNQTCPNYCSVCFSGVCYVCQDSYYFSSSTGNCQPMTILCSIGSTFSSCGQCNNEISRMGTNGYCIPSYIVKDYNQLIYITSINNPSVFFVDNLTTASSSKRCTNLGSVSNSYFIKSQTTGILQVQYNVVPSYQILVRVQLSVSNIPNNITVVGQNMNFPSNLILQFESTLSKVSCPQDTFIKNFQFSFSPSNNFNATNKQTPFVLTFFSSSNTTQIGVSQIYIQLFRCLVTNCQSCQSSYTCQSCVYPYRLQNNLCSSICQEGFYFNQIQMTCAYECTDGYYAILQDYRCLKCPFPCFYCKSETVCVLCQSGWYLSNNNTCVSVCENGYYEDNSSWTCQYCSYPCKQCQTVYGCTSCQLGYFYAENKTCVYECPIGYYTNFTVLQCQLCEFPCQSCSYTSTTCTSCNNQTFLYINNCIKSCPEGYVGIIYQTNSSKECVQCKFPCKDCQNSSSICLSCVQGYVYNGSCYNQCPLMFYKNVENNTCDQCLSPCLRCSDISICTSCSLGFKLVVTQGICVQKCPKTTYLVTTVQNQNQTQQICSTCVPPCLECTNKTYCLSCTGLLFLNHIGQCLLSCPMSTYIFYNQTIAIRQCTNCPTNCISCSSYQNCLQCINSYLYLGTCYVTCPNQTFASLGYWICQSCSYPCLNCLNQYQCLSCYSQFLFVQDQNMCVETCPLGYYEILSSINASSCFLCDSKCFTCQLSASNCIQCAAGYQKLSQIGDCVSQCPSGYFASPINKVCNKCFFPCLDCLSSTSCISCDQNSTYPIFYMYKCLSDCPLNMLAQTINKTLTCSNCKFPCQSCQIQSNNCTSCHYGFSTYYNSTIDITLCLQICPSETFDNLGNCQACSYPCKTCINENVCKSCQGKLILMNNQCLDSCPFHYYADISGSNDFYFCLRCSDICRQCKTFNFCLSCISNKYVYQDPLNSLNFSNTCVDKCPIYYYADSNTMTCLICILPCLQCYSQEYCKTCSNGFFLQGAKCVTKCQDGYYQNLTLNMCSPCISPCKTCYNDTKCLSCVIGIYYISDNNTCSSQCPQAQYKYLSPSGYGTCMNCSPYCFQCIDYSICLSCPINSSRKYLQNGICQTNCSQGYFLSNNSASLAYFTCFKCSSMCIQCLSQSTCQKCISSFLLNGNCVSECPSLYYGSTFFTCELCQAPCLQCYNQANCINCQQNYFLYNKICVKKCPQNMWADLQLQECVQNCSVTKLMNLENKTCLVQCQKFYSTDRYCRSICSSNEFINKSLGCQSCSQEQTNCLALPKYQSQFIYTQGNFYLLIVYSQLMNNFQVQSTNFQLILSRNLINSNQLDISFLRNLQQASSIIGNLSVNIDRLSQNSIWLKLELPQTSGILTVDQNNFTTILSKSNRQLPLQTLSFSTQIDSFYPVSLPNELFYISTFMSFFVIILLLINLVLDNVRSVFILLDQIHIIWIAILGFHGWTGLQNFTSGFDYLIGVGIQSHSSYTKLWDCDGKDILYFGGCNFLPQLIYVSIYIGIFILIAGISKLFLKKLKHQIVYNHLNNFYWIFSSPILFIACKQYAYSSSILALILICLMGLYTMMISYQILKNVFNCSYSQLTFFWGLKRHKLKNQIGNLHFLLLIIRKSIVVFTVCLFPETTLTAMFLVSLTSIIILSNMITNMPFKHYQILLIIIQTLIICFYFGLEIFWVNIQKLDNSVYLAWSASLVAVIVVLLLLTIYITLVETIKCVKKVHKKYKISSSVDQNNQQRSSQSQNTIKQKEQKQKKVIIGSQQQTENKLLSGPLNEDFNNKQLLKEPQQSEENSDLIFSQKGSSQQSQFQKPAKYLVRVEKNETMAKKQE